jgi:V8-like Glu-specific endopeptidase
MKLSLLCSFIIASIFAINANGSYILNKGIYGEDNRNLVSEMDPNFDFLEINQARSVFAQIPKWTVNFEDQAVIKIEAKNLAEGFNFCPWEKYAQLPVVASCSAFLVGPDLILTAGHCIKDKVECANNYWVLDYNDNAGFLNSNKVVTFTKDKVYSCSKILSWSNNPKLDYALIKLNRKVTDRSALAIRRTGKIDNSDALFVIGHPLGLPKILANKANVRNNSLNYTFLTTADTFSGNSGSPVINPVTHLVEGILIKGDEDFKMDINQGCNVTSHCSNFECKGETVQRTTVLPLDLIPKI